MKSRLEALKEFLEKDPGDSFTRYALALEHLSLKDFEQGLTLLKETIERDARYVAAYQQLGQQLQRLGQTREAVEWYEKGIHVAHDIRDFHAASEMRNELEEILSELESD